MAPGPSTKANLSHEERTATEPRNKDLHPVILDKITPVNSRTRTFRFNTKDPKGINFLPGQWLDVHVPGIEKAGGFTITSPPRHAVPSSEDRGHRPFLELAIQKSPDNPPAAWLWQPENEILGKELQVRVGGSFVWPPPGLETDSIKRAVFIAGGVGINPLISMISHICQDNPSLEVSLLYSTKLPSYNLDISELLFLPQILDLFRTRRTRFLELFFTGTWDGTLLSSGDDFIRKLIVQPELDRKDYVPYVVRTRRIQKSDLLRALGPTDERSSSVFYVCGPPEMTDSVVEQLRESEGVERERVLCEKWW